MKSLLAIPLFFQAFATLTQGAEWQDEYGRLLKKYVTPNGVRYAEWKANGDDMKGIGTVVEAIAAVPASTAKSKEQLAFHINAYNAWILHEVLEKYPTKSIKDPLFTFFTSKRITVAGEKMSFNRLEKEIIRPRFDEPRVHFALNCASRSCPPLRDAPYSTAALDTELEQQARAFINSSKGVAVTKDGANLSKIFDWYKDDFGGPAGVITFINKRHATPIPANAKLSYQEYDWSLNESK